ncbi:MAG TPA: CNNM domain-containing protein [Verrucomicrobiae bacterium]|nr:CNNM domain-containing protein [Verrucomicrobiae bacterium]
MQHTVVIVFVVGLLLSFILSGMEAGVFALSRLRIRHYVRQGQRRARVLHEYLEKPESFLWTILIGNTLSAVAVVSIGVHWLHRWLAPNWILLTLSLAAGILIYYAAFELLPKSLFRLFPNRLCLALALPFRAVYVALRPVVTPLAVISRALLRWSGGQRFTGHMFGNRDELRIVMQESGQALSTEERSMINRVLDLQVLSTAAITTPWDKLVVFSTDTPVAEALARAREVGFASVPVWRNGETRRRIAGLLDLSALLYSDTVNMAGRVGDYLQPALYLDEGTRLEVALRQMQRTGQRLAIVLGRDGTEVGIVTLHDILNVIFSGVRRSHEH